MKKNRLADESSLYLKSHAENPVDWFPWGNEALERAKRLDRPIFLSIGYSSCHWCHVMEEESFSDLKTAKILNENFVSIKVDREERPDIDRVYMSAVQILTQRGGWPLSVFLTPELLPFYGGTYFPSEDRHAVPSFTRLLGGIIQAWKEKRSDLSQTADHLAASIRSVFEVHPTEAALPPYVTLFKDYLSKINAIYDSKNGGFGSAPKFFHTEMLHNYLDNYLYRSFEESLVKTTDTLDKISRGGVFDQLAGGFHRYSTDDLWLVPHFEKMLYDNALLAGVFVRGFATGRAPELSQTARSILDFILTEMTSPEGYFFSAIDADSDGAEGRFYVWKLSELEQLLSPDDSAFVQKLYGVTAGGNFDGASVLFQPVTLTEFLRTERLDSDAFSHSLDRVRRILRVQRDTRPRPQIDEKLVVAPNAMMIESFALASRVFDDPVYLETACRAAELIWRSLSTSERLGHSKMNSHISQTGFLDDHAFYLNAMIELFLSSQDPLWLDRSLSVGRWIIDHFWDSTSCQFFYESRFDKVIISRTHDLHDGATPSSSATAVTGLLRLGLITGKNDFTVIGERVLQATASTIALSLHASGSWVRAASLLEGKSMIFCPGSSKDSNDRVIEALKPSPSSRSLLVIRTDSLVNIAPAHASKIAVRGEPTLYVCTIKDCQAPIIGERPIRDYVSLSHSSK